MSSQVETISAPTELVVERHADIAAIAPEWDGLAERAGAAPFLRPGWIEAWLEAFGGTPTIVTVRERDGLKAVLPLVRRRGALELPANPHTPLAGPVADDPAAVGEIAAALLSPPAARTDLRMLDGSDPLLAELRRAAHARRNTTIERVTDRQPYVELSGSFEEYEAGLPRKQRKELRRMQRRLSEEGEVTFEFRDGSERLDALLDEGFAIEGSGWKDEQGTAIKALPEIRRFYTAVARWAAAHGLLRLAFLRLDGRPLAFDFCLQDSHAFYALKGGYDVDYRRFGPGSLLTYDSLRHAFGEGLASYEFLGADDPYKLNWTTTTHERVRFQVFSRSLAGRAQHVAWRRGRPLVKRAQERLSR